MRSITLTYAALIPRIILFAFVATVLSCSPESDMDSRELAYKLEENTQRVFNNARLNGMLFISVFPAFAAICCGVLLHFVKRGVTQRIPSQHHIEIPQQ
ncbi:hypothetical protein GCM10011318_17490 [Phaeocystidibacter marisrubri]|nr:hypothetical protein GCM10011318_17490 [Phaeocystidibacter marisrubri]